MVDTNIQNDIMDKVLLILEKQTVPMTVIDADNFILEGIAAVFDRENENGRIYTWEEYKPHLAYLLKKIEKNKLVGEMDHPEVFETSLKNITHIITKLWYDEKENVLRVRLKLLDTDPYGLNARKLVKAGFPLSLSSRAAGSVGEGKKVKIKHIFAYDLVADGGFGDYAELSKVAETLGFDPKDFILTENKEACLNGACGIEKASNIRILDVSTKYEGLNESVDFLRLDSKLSGIKLEEINEETTHKNKLIKMAENQNNSYELTEKAMQRFSLVVKEEFKRINEGLGELTKRVNNISEGATAGEGDTKIQESIDNLISYTTKLSTIIKENKGDIASISAMKDELEQIKEEQDNLKAYGTRLSEDINNNRGYAGKLAEHINLNREYSGKLRESILDGISYSEKNAELIAEEVNNLIGYTGRITETVNFQSGYLDKVQKTVNSGIKYTEHIAKNSLVKEDFIHLANYTDEMLESIKANNTGAAVNEGAKADAEAATSYGSINEKIDAVLAKIVAKKNEANAPVYTNALKLNEEESLEFASLNESQKANVESQLAEGVKFIAAANAAKNPDAKFLTEMPEEYIAAWKSLDESAQSNIMLRAQKYNLDSAYQIRYFWANQNLGSAGVEVKKVNEEKTTKIEENLSTGYSKSMIERVGEQMDRFN